MSIRYPFIRPVVVSLILVGISVYATMKVTNFFRDVDEMRTNNAALQLKVQNGDDALAKAQLEIDSLKTNPLP